MSKQGLINYFSCAFLFCLLTVVNCQKNITACTATQYYDTITMNCKECGPNQKPFLDIGCQCNSGFEFSKDQIGFVKGKGGTEACVPCTNCICPAIQARIRFSEDGSPIQTLNCTSCKGAFLNAKQECVPCPSRMTYVKECACPTGSSKSGNICVLDKDFSSLGTYADKGGTYNQIEFNDYIGDGNQQIRSQTITNYYIKAATGCKTYKDHLSCSLLANLCLLTLDMQTSACQLFQSIKSEKTQTLPNLFYSQSGKVVLEETKMKMLMSFKGNKADQVHWMSFYIAEYNFEGEMTKDIRPITSEIMLCSNSPEDGKLMARFGITYENNCELDLRPFVTDYKTKFYQMFMKDIDETFIPIPILVTKLINGKLFTNLNKKKKRVKPPMMDKINPIGNSPIDFLWWKIWEGLNCKKFIFNQFSNKAVRFARKAKFSFSINNAEDDKMFLPYFQITYNEKQVKNGDITNGDPTEAFVPVEFRVNYEYDAESFYTVAGILLIVVHVIIGVIWIIRIWIWAKHTPSYVASDTWSLILMYRAIQLAIDTWAEVIFYFIFGMTGYWFCFFKFQESIYVLMPPMSDYENNYRPYEILFYLMFAFRILSTIALIYRQGEVEVFFVDWEKTEIQRPEELDQRLKNKNKILEDIRLNKSKKSVWRTLLIANEFNELQTFRIVSVEWTILFTGLFLIGLRWEDLASEQPNMNLDNSVPHQYILRYFISTFIYLIIGIVQIVIRKLFDIWFPIAIEDFVDLCSIANISIFVIDDILHGYYIHGENPTGFSEGTGEHLQQCLQNEAQGKGKKRGFIQTNNAQSGDSNLQTFELFLSLRFRESYDKVFMIPVRTLTDQANNVGYQNISFFRNPTPLELDMHLVELNKSKISYFIKDVLTQIRNNPSQNIRNKLAVQRFLNYPPPELEQPDFKDQSLPVFFRFDMKFNKIIRDPDYSFKSIFFCGQEFYFLITDTIIFNFWLMITSNTFAALLLAYLTIEGFVHYRQWLGERNLSDKSKIDQRFLI